ncbi:MAG: lipoyl synthase [Deltaproteobacteria bacterium]|nr:lipoyl synthase [Deltaproteobacteria bacterium]MBW1952109.1 lipoyl synthase [Deltaproteobacteria bacterium]MBW1987632.1 lipoyl synthase [Deltaproteobacteria bacterium]MBW2135605.1 lipoyl synthase [Deltaproteobacteria bacterium]
MKFPGWLADRLAVLQHHSLLPNYHKTNLILRNLQLKTICQSGRCPNLGSCFSQRVATFLILGEVCTRGCRFCAVARGQPASVAEDEPFRLLQAVRELGLSHVIITSVTRDDLADGGAGHFAQVVRTVRLGTRGVSLEILTPDFGGRAAALESVAASGPEVWGHNIETVPRLYRRVRPGADYYRSLQVLSQINYLTPKVMTKSGLMLGLGETPDEVYQVLQDLRTAAVELVTLGQYLAPSGAHSPVARYVLPEEFAHWSQVACELGFKGVAAGPLVRSSFQAKELYRNARLA